MPAADAVRNHGERNRLRALLSGPGRSLFRLPQDLEEGFARHHHALALANLRAYWPAVVLAVGAIAALTFFSGIVPPDMLGLTVLGYAIMFGVIALVVAGALVPRLNAHIDKLVSIAAFLGLLAMHIATLLGETGNPMQNMAENGVIFITLAACTISNLSFRRAITACVAATLAFLVVVAVTGWQPHWAHFPFYGPGALLIAAIAGWSHEIRERTVFLQQRLLALEKDELDTMTQALSLMSREDSLTGLANRRHFDEVAQREWAGCQREGRTFNVLFIDIDHFKGYNDRYGHQAGDACLARVGAALGKQALRGGDLVARYGGEEFVALFPNTSREGLLVIAQRLLEAIDELEIPHAASSACRHVTLSVGVASLAATREGRLEDALRAADEALYEAKARGRHRVVARWQMGQG